MAGAGEKLRRVRERLKLTHRDAERAGNSPPTGSSDFKISLSRLRDIENRGVLPASFGCTPCPPFTILIFPR
jgi:hypothetical protein